MLKIRLTRTGKTKRPHFRVVVMEHTSAAQGPYVAALGNWDPLDHKFTIDEGQLKLWMDRGAKPTDRISRLLKNKGIKHKLIQIHERPAHGPKNLKVKAKEEVGVSEAPEVNVKAAEGQAETLAATPEAPETPVTETAEAPTEKPAAEQQQTDQEVKTEETTPAAPIEPATSEVNTATAEREEQAKSPAGDQA